MKVKVLAFLMFFIATFFINSVASYADPDQSYDDFSSLFENQGVIMLLIDQVDGEIVDANKAAVEFYGYDKSKLLSMKISDINVLNPEEINEKMSLAVQRKNNIFSFQHKLSDGSVRSVEAYSYPIHFGDRDVLFAIIHDVSDKIELQKQHEAMGRAINVMSILVILVLLILIEFLVRNGRRLKKANNLIDNMNALRNSFINADKRLIYLKDENLNYAFVNRALEEFYGKTSDEIIGKDDYKLSDHESAEQRRRTDMEVIKTGDLIIDEEQWDGHDYEVTKFPVQMPNGKYGVGAYKRDITEERILENNQKRFLMRHMILVDILTREYTGKGEHMDYVLTKALELTESQYGYIYFYDESTEEFQLNSWSNGVMKDCEIINKQTKYELHKTGFWGEVVRQKKPIIENNFERNHSLKKGYPEGHVAIKRFMSVPVIVDDKIAAVIGLANKKTDYDENDVYETTILMNGVWNELIRKESQEQLSIQRNKYLQTLISIGDGVMVVDCSGNVEILNMVAERLTGWSNIETVGKSYKKIFQLSHQKEGKVINDPVEEVLKNDTICELGNHGILTSKNGTRYHIEDSAAPIKDSSGKTIGVVLVFRDVTEKKEQQDKIEYLSFHDALTGLYNRRFFEEELHRIDVARNLPISIIMGDANGLKITNDIFGHAYGDMLLRKISEAIRKECRNEDIIARWGGDEFVVLLPKTNEAEACQIKERIEEALTRQEIRAIKASAAFGCDTKKDMGESIIEVLDRAEGKMYRNKTLARDDFKIKTTESIINKLHEIEPKERKHSQKVSELSLKLGEKLGVADKDLRILKRAGYLHDIGKVIFESEPFESDKMDYDEREKHVLIGYRIMSSFESQDIADIILSHHEQWDGNGYPRGLGGEDIPLLARILAAADLYYKIKNAPENLNADNIGMIQKASGNRLDPMIANALIEVLNTGRFNKRYEK